MPTRRITLRDLAAAGGVSHNTVAMALRHDPGVSAATGQRIRELAATMGYRPNALVSALMSEVRTRQVTGSPVLALLNAWPERSALQERLIQRQYVLGMCRRADELGYTVEEFWLMEPGMSGVRLGNILTSRGISGVLLPGLPEACTTVPLPWERLAAAACGPSLLSPDLHRAGPAFHRAMTLALGELANAGIRRVGLVLDPVQDTRNEHLWSAGFLWQQRQLAKADRIPPLLVSEEQEDVFRTWRRRHKPAAILTSLLFLPSLPEWLKRCGGKTAAGTPLVTLYESSRHPGVSRVDANAPLIGATCVDLVVSQLQRNERGIPAFRKDVLIDPVWVRGSLLQNKHSRAD